jgi:L-fuconolactonase
MVTEADWSTWKPADLQPYVDIALESFGPSRCMFGSDWPVCGLAGSYGEVLAALRELVEHLSESEQAKILGDTARSFYRLNG